MTKIEVGDKARAKAIFEALYASEPNVRGTKFDESEIYRFIEGILEQLETSKIEPEVEPTWRRIPEFDNYEISKVTGGVRNRHTKQVLKVYVSATQHGPTTHVEMHDKEGYLKQVSLDYLYQTLFEKEV